MAFSMSAFSMSAFSMSVLRERRTLEILFRYVGVFNVRKRRRKGRQIRILDVCIRRVAENALFSMSGLCSSTVFRLKFWK